MNRHQRRRQMLEQAQHADLGIGLLRHERAVERGERKSPLAVV
jgi:hypothetical protein